MQNCRNDFQSNKKTTTCTCETKNDKTIDDIFISPGEAEVNEIMTRVETRDLPRNSKSGSWGLVKWSREEILRKLVGKKLWAWRTSRALSSKNTPELETIRERRNK